MSESRSLALDIGLFRFREDHELFVLLLSVPLRSRFVVGGVGVCKRVVIPGKSVSKPSRRSLRADERFASLHQQTSSVSSHGALICIVGNTLQSARTPLRQVEMQRKDTKSSCASSCRHTALAVIMFISVSTLNALSQPQFQKLQSPVGGIDSMGGLCRTQQFEVTVRQEACGSLEKT